MKNKILITGGTGYIGKVLANSLVKKNDVFVVDNLSNSKKIFLNKKIKFYKLDIKNIKKISLILSQNQIDTIFHLASKKSVSDSIKFKKKYYQEIYINTINLYSLAKKFNVRNFIFSSTAAVYGDNFKVVKESFKCKPITPYGKFKYMAENKLITLNKKDNLNLIIFRYFNVVGVSKLSGNHVNFDGSLFSNILKSFMQKKIFKIFGNNFSTKDGFAVRDFVHVEDIVYIHSLMLNKLKTLKKKFFGIFNIGYGTGFSVMQVIKSFLKIQNFKIIFKVYPRRLGDIQISVASNSRLINFLNPKFKYDKIDIITKCYLNFIKKIKIF